MTQDLPAFGHRRWGGTSRKLSPERVPREVAVGEIIDAQGKKLNFYMVGLRYDRETKLLTAAQQLQGDVGGDVPKKNGTKRLKRNASSTSTASIASTCGSNREGLHPGQSGRHFLEALKGQLLT
jgi:hypothetical protein